MSSFQPSAAVPTLHTAPDAHGGGPPAEKQRAAGLSVASNSTLILLKVIAGTLTGSVAILTEAVHSSVDLIASLVAFFSVRKAGEPADETHRYGHERMEDLAAAIEGVLILVGSAAIAFEAVRRLLSGGRTHTLGLGIAVIAVSTVVNLVVSAVLARRGRATASPALMADAAHLRTDALSSGIVLLALVLVDATGQQWIDPVAALLVAAAIVITGVRLLTGAGQVLVDQALPGEEVTAVRKAIESFGTTHGVVGYHELRSRRGGSQRYIDVHVQFRSGTSLENAHRTAHQLQAVIARALGGADVLIHLEPQDRVRPGETLVEPPAPSSATGSPTKTD
ncbi:MAG TPA: cation diffusion facilitator family transporter [Solirubrobacteraceae bacterium]|jgi:cation diffusion facilitator family transporter|nr:cation diffusion facilitator family transporter [Solirubrobacteraceae bacterium]